VSEPYDEAYFAERDELPSHISLTLNNLLAASRAHSVLEVGFGSGRLMKFLEANGYDAYGIDKSPIAAKLAGAIVASAAAIPFSHATFDCVAGISVIEHLDFDDGNQFVAEAYRVLKPGGFIFLITPNFSSPLRYVQRTNWFGYSDRSHVMFYTPHTMRQVLARCGFDAVRFTFRLDSTKLDWALPAFFHRLTPSLRRLVNQSLVAWPLAFFRESFWVAARKPW
jgi:SAM-dependent methyltransferase